jgi:ribonuclease G
MPAEILINVRPHLTRVAFVENGNLLDLKIEQKTSPTLVGSIFKGRVIRVLPGMQAAFVDIGLERAGFLFVGDIKSDLSEDLHVSERELDLEEEALQQPASRTPIQELLREGQTVLVQVAKDPIGTKGARLTTYLSLPGRFVVYLPTLKHVGISRKIEGESEKQRLRELLSKINPEGGVIVRTAGEQASEQDLRADIEYLDRTWREIKKNYDKRKHIGLLHSELDVELRALRDLLSHDVHAVYVDAEEEFKKVVKFVGQLIPHHKQKIVYYEGQAPLFDMYDIELEISRSLDRKLWLKSGGYIVIDETEALTVIDVNTGKFVGKKDLEDTILKTNLEAAKEIANQLRIRNCGGIIIIDFIDMEKESHREKVLSTLREEVSKDRVRNEIVSMSSLGLVEMTRKRTRPSLLKELSEPCKYCEGTGFVKRPSVVAHEIFRELEREKLTLLKKSGGVQVFCHSTLIDWIYQNESEYLSLIEKALGQSISFKTDPSYHIEQFTIF